MGKNSGKEEKNQKDKEYREYQEDNQAYGALGLP
jgi:hypothetical protein